MLEHKDYLSSLNKARRKRNQKMDPRTLVLLMAAAAAIGIIIFGVIGIKNILSDREAGPTPVQEVQPATSSQAEPMTISQVFRRIGL